MGCSACFAVDLVSFSYLGFCNDMQDFLAVGRTYLGYAFQYCWYHHALHKIPDRVRRKELVGRDQN